MAPGLQIVGLFLVITGALAFTAWAEMWLASTSAPISKPSAAPGLADLGNEGEAIRAA